MGKADRCVVRNQAYRKAGLSIRERHNERKNSGYANADIDQSRAAMNVHFKQCQGTYAEAFDRLVETGTISTRGLKQDAKVVDEMVFDVNTAYFEKHGGYEYAKQFFAQAYQMAVQETGGEQYILSAVMHADERNRAMSEELGRDVYHYHLHVVYVPVVEKEIKWSKRCRDPALIGTTKEVIHQVSHSKKWASAKALDENGSVIRKENGRAVLIPSYSLLQSRFYEHMRSAGYQDIERGERGSTAEHLGVLDYKIQRDIKRLEGLGTDIEGKEKQAAALDKAVKRKEGQLSAVTQAQAAYSELEWMGKKNLFGRIELQPDEWKKLLSLAKKGLVSQSEIQELRRKLAGAVKDSDIYRSRWRDVSDRAGEYLELQRLYPEQAKAALEEVKAKEQIEKGSQGKKRNPIHER